MTHGKLPLEITLSCSGSLAQGQKSSARWAPSQTLVDLQHPQPDGKRRRAISTRTTCASRHPVITFPHRHGSSVLVETFRLWRDSNTLSFMSGTAELRRPALPRRPLRPHTGCREPLQPSP